MPKGWDHDPPAKEELVPFGILTVATGALMLLFGVRDILNRMNYRLKRIQKGKPLKKTEQTDAIFANVKQVRDQARKEPETLEISMDAKAKVALGEYVRGGKNADRQRR